MRALAVCLFLTFSASAHAGCLAWFVNLFAFDWAAYDLAPEQPARSTSLWGQVWTEVLRGVAEEIREDIPSPEVLAKGDEVIARFYNGSLAAQQIEALEEKRRKVAELVNSRGMQGFPRQMAQGYTALADAQDALRKATQIPRITYEACLREAGLKESDSAMRSRVLKRLEAELCVRLPTLSAEDQFAFLEALALLSLPLKRAIDKELWEQLAQALRQNNEWGSFAAGLQSTAVRRLAPLGTQEAWTVVGEVLFLTISTAPGVPWPMEIAKELLETTPASPEKTAAVQAVHRKALQLGSDRHASLVAQWTGEMLQKWKAPLN
ncbi:hypothetical protein K2X33_16330 [bacterium]|nr:hypothetical protein [bacterium]